MSLELGGKNANIIFDDCDLDQAVETTMLTSFSNQGQICLCGSRLLIQQGIYPKFKQKLLEAIQKLPVGNPMDPATRVGAIVSKSHFEKILSYIQIAKDEGGKILCGGEKLSPPGECTNGYFIQPTVIEGLDNMARCNQEEIFGPVVTLQSFATLEEAISLANGTPYGLAASIWTQDLKQAHVVADALDSGIIWVNCWMIRDLRTPFGGMKQSGVGREGGWESMRFFTEPKNICIKY
jgi:aminomuconate-semialdehyde/2-hydroxymuconate-6-semialdehyde dehydrogenase